MNAARIRDVKNINPPTITPTHTKMSPEDLWSKWSDILGISAAILGGFTAIVALIAWGVAWKASKLKDAASERYRIEADARISEAHANSADANKIAAEAKERTATLERDTAQARLELEQVKERQRFREITDEQKASFIREMKNIPKCEIPVREDDSTPETVQYASQIRNMIIEAGFTSPIRVMIATTSSNNNLSDVYLTVKDLKSPPPSANPIFAAMLNAGIMMHGGWDASLGPNDIKIYVGRKYAK